MLLISYYFLLYLYLNRSVMVSTMRQSLLVIISIVFILTGCSKTLDSDFPKQICERVRPAVIRQVKPPENATITSHELLALEVLWSFEHGDGLVPTEWPPVKLWLDDQDITQEARIGLTANFPSTAGGILYYVTEPLEQGRHTARIMLKSYKGKEYCFEWDFFIIPN